MLSKDELADGIAFACDLNTRHCAVRLASDDLAKPRTLKAAMVFAESMVHELQESLTEWEATVSAIERMKHPGIAGSSWST